MANISKIHLPDESILGLRASGILIGRTDSTSTATVQTATVPGLTELFDGMFMFIYNSTIASASGWTLNINGLGAKQVYNSQNARTTTGFSKNTWFPLIYDGVHDRFVIGYMTDNNTTYSNVSLGQGYGTCTTAAATVAKVVSLSSYALTVNGIVAVKFTNDVPANATMNINSKGAKAIYHRGAAITDGVIKGGDTAYFIYNTYYHLLGVDRIPASSPFISGTGPYSAMLKPEDNGDIEASGNYSVAEGAYTTAAGNYSHAEGMATQANGAYSHAEGRATSAENDYEHTQGRFNVSNKASTSFGDAGNTIHSIGIGTSASNKKNALEIMQNGDAYIYGVGEYDGTTITGKTTLQNVISNKQDELVSGTNVKTVNNNSILGSGNISVGTVTGSSLTANNIILGNGSSAIKSSGKTIATTLGTDDTTVPTSKAVKDAIDALPEPMIFQGTLGTGGTITSLPAAAAGNTGYTYKVITNGTYQSIAAKAGDTFISNGSTWTLIPSGDEPSGTVTNIATGTGLTGGPITTTGTIAVDTSVVALKSELSAPHYLVDCSTAADVVNKEISIGDGVTNPVGGTVIDIRFTNGNSVNSPKLIINGGNARTLVCKVESETAKGLTAYDISKEVPLRVVVRDDSKRYYVTGVRPASTILSGYVRLSDTPGTDQTTAATPYLVNQAVSGIQPNVQSDWNATSGLAQILNKPTIPAAVTESTVSGWGFTKNAGTVTSVKVGTTSYNPSSGIVSLPAYPSVPSEMTASEATTGTSTTARTISASVLTSTIDAKITTMTQTEVDTIVNTIFS